MKKTNSEENYFHPKMIIKTQSSKDSRKISLLAKKTVKYFPIITPDSQNGGHTFYIATQENDIEEEFNKNLKIKNGINNGNSFQKNKKNKKNKKKIIPQKSIVLQIDNVKPIKNLNTQQFHSYTNSTKTEPCEKKIIVNKREPKNKNNNINKKNVEVLNFPTLKNATTKQILECAKTLNNRNLKNISSKSLYTFQNENQKSQSFFDFFKLNLNSKIFDKTNRNNENLAYSINLNDNSSFMPSKVLENSMEINNKSKIINESEEKNKNFNYSDNSFNKKIIRGKNREKEIIYQKYKHNVNTTKRKKEINKNDDKIYNFSEKTKQNYNNSEIIKNNKLIKSPGFFVKRTMFEEHYFIDENGNKKLLKVEEFSNYEHENKTENVEKIKQKIKNCYSNNTIYNKKIQRDTIIESIDEKNKSNIFFKNDKQDSTNLYRNINSSLNRYKNLIRVNRGLKYNTNTAPKNFTKIEEKNSNTNSNLNFMSKSNNFSYHEIKGFSKKTNNNTYRENTSLPFKYNIKKNHEVIHINHDTFNDKNRNNFTIRKKAETKLQYSNSDKNEYKLASLREKQRNNYFFLNINNNNYEKILIRSNEKNGSSNYYSTEYCS